MQAMITGGPALLSSMCTFAVSAQTQRITFNLSALSVSGVSQGEYCLQCTELSVTFSLCLNVSIHLLAVLHNYNGRIVFPKSRC